MSRIFVPTVAGMAAEGAPFVGVLFAGVMVTPDGAKLIEFNTRFGDPECQTLLARLDSDLAPLLLAAARGDLASARPAAFSPRHAATIVLAAQGYPEAPLTGSIIRGLQSADMEEVEIFHAGTRRDEDGLLRAAGGRVLNVTATGATLRAAVDRGYQSVGLIDWPGGFHRSDIGWRALS
jgi:phosphoribosylamine--glycine ligase